MTSATQSSPTTPVGQPSASAPPASHAPDSGFGELLRRLEACTSRRAAYAAGLSYVAEQLNAPYAALTMDVDHNSLEETVAASEDARKSWRRHCDGLMLNARYRGVSQARFFQARGMDRTFAILTVPLVTAEDGTVGAMAVVVACRHRDLAAAHLSTLHAIATILALKADTARQRKRHAGDPLALSKVAAHRSLEEFCFALTNSLKTNLGCDQVALGLVRRSAVDVACVSGFDNLYPRSPGTRLIQQAMCECLDAGDIVCCQVEGGADGVATGHQLHKQWHASMGASPVASVPLFVEDTCVAIVSICNPGGSPFRAKHLTKVQELVSPMMPGLLLLEKANRSATQRAGESVRAFLGAFREPGRLRRKLAAVAAVVALSWVAFGRTDYRLTVPCLVESTDDLQLSAPFEEAITAAFVEPGDHVTAGQPIAQLDTRALQSEREKTQAAWDAAKIRTLRGLQADDLAAAAQANAEAMTAEARLRELERKLAAATILAPSDGLIIDGLLDSRIGEIVELGEPLVRFAPAGQWKVTVHAPDHVAADLAHGQMGVAAVSARPDVSIPLKLVQVHAAAHIQEGKNVFTAEADLQDAPPPWLRGGMRGVAQIQVGKRPVWWVWAHRAIDSVRLTLWKI